MGVLLLGGAVAPLPAFIEMPGTAAAIPPCVAIDGHRDAMVNGNFLLTTVAQRDATVFGLAVAALRGDQRVVGERQLLGDDRRDQYLRRQRRMFIDATDRAVVVALRAAGLTVDVVGSGADVVDVIDGAPADGVLRPGDVITSVDGETITTDAALIDAVSGVDPLDLEIERDGAVRSVRLTPEPRVVDGELRHMIGVRITTFAPQVRLPFDVDVLSGRIGGPSAGLMVGLAVLDLVDDDDLAKGRRIAGTGTLGIDGTVGTIDDIDLKVAAAAREGAEVFLAPDAQVDDARSAVPAGSHLTVVGVDSFDAARSALQQPADEATAGGRAPPLACRSQPDA
ncbi:MAG TPA: PDZ domain-containing protein [Euzebyales bacterium]